MSPLSFYRVWVFLHQTRVPWPSVLSYNRNSMQDGSKLLATLTCALTPCNALPNRTEKTFPRAAPGILLAALPSKHAMTRSSQKLPRVSSLPRSVQQDCYEKTFPRAASGILCNALSASIFQCFPQHNCDKKTFPSGTALRRPRTAMRRPSPSCVGHPSCNVFPSRPATRRPS